MRLCIILNKEVDDGIFVNDVRNKIVDDRCIFFNYFGEMLKKLYLKLKYNIYNNISNYS